MNYSCIVLRYVVMCGRAERAICVARSLRGRPVAQRQLAQARLELPAHQRSGVQRAVAESAMAQTASLKRPVAQPLVVTEPVVINRPVALVQRCMALAAVVKRSVAWADLL